MHQAALKQSNLSPMGKLALTDALPFTFVEALAKARGKGNHPSSCCAIMATATDSIAPVSLGWLRSGPLMS